MSGSPAPHPSSAEWFDSCNVAELRQRRGAKWRKYGPDVLPAWVADMDFPPAPPVRAALEDLLAAGDLGYPWLDPDPVAAAFADWSARRYGFPLDPAAIVSTVDVLQPLQAAIVAHSEPGDGVVIQTPIYPPFLKVLAMTERELVDHPLGAAEDGYPLDIDGLERVIDARTRILLLCNPHNPSGRVFTRSELEALGAVAEAHDLVVISDEIHADLTYGEARHIPFASLSPSVAARTITLTSATKSFNIAGLGLAGARELVASGRTSDPAGFFLEHARVGLNDGREFGRHGDGFVRLNFATSRSVLTEVLERMATALR